MKIEVLHFMTITKTATVIISDCFPLRARESKPERTVAQESEKKNCNWFDAFRSLFAPYRDVSGYVFFSLCIPVCYLQLIAGWFSYIVHFGSPERWKLIHSSYYHTLKDNQWAAWWEYYANVHCVCNAHQIMTCNSLIASIMKRPYSLSLYP